MKIRDEYFAAIIYPVDNIFLDLSYTFEYPQEL